MTGLGDEWKAVDSVYLDFRKAFNSLNILMHKLEEQELHKQTESLTENWLNRQDPRVAITGTLVGGQWLVAYTRG